MINPHTPMRTRIVKSMILSALALLIGFAVSYGLTLLHKPPPLREPARRVYNVEVFRVECNDVREVIRAFGTSKANREVVLSAQVAGEVAEVHPQLKIGLHVQAQRLDSAGADRYQGDLLLRIDPMTYEARVNQGQTHLAEDRAELDRLRQEASNLDRLNKTISADFDDSKREYDKTAQLREKGVNTDSDMRRAQMDLRQHEKSLVQNRNEIDLLPARRELILRKIESHEADLKLAEIELARTSIRPPFTGNLNAVHVEIGQYVRVGDPLVSITDDLLVEVPLSLTLDDYARLIPSIAEQKFPSVELAENESAPTRWTGRVVRMSPKADEQTRTAMIYVVVDNSQQKAPLLPGTFVQARIDGPVLEKAKIVPRDAVLQGQALVDREGVVQVRHVAISRTLQNLAVIEQGLEPGDQLILTNLDALYDGAKVRASGSRTLIDELAGQRSPAARRIEESAPPVSERDSESIAR